MMQVKGNRAAGTYLIHEAGQRPVEGVGVWRYSWGWKCERDGAPIRTTRPDCLHIEKAREFEEEGDNVLES